MPFDVTGEFWQDGKRVIPGQYGEDSPEGRLCAAAESVFPDRIKRTETADEESSEEPNSEDSDPNEDEEPKETDSGEETAKSDGRRGKKKDGNK